MEDSINLIAKSTAIEPKVRRFRKRMAGVFQVGQDEVQEELLNLLADAYKDYLRAEELVAAEGMLVAGRRAGERKRNAALLTARDSRYQMLRLLKALSEGRDRSKARMEEADAWIEDALCAGPRVVNS